MTHTAGTPLLWWFQFIESDDQYGNFKGLAAFHKGEDRRGQGMVQTVPTFPSPHYDLAALALQNPKKAYVWVYAQTSTESWPSAARTGTVFKGTSILLANMTPGKYRVEVWDTHKGEIITQSDLTAQGSSLTIPLPEFRIDCAVKVKLAQ
jgi:hypothetical protein